jgi:hypothetical protein
MEPTQTDLTSHAHTPYRIACHAATESCAEGVRPFEVTKVWVVKTPRLGASPSESIIHSIGKLTRALLQTMSSKESTTEYEHFLYAWRMEVSSFKLSESLRLTRGSRWSWIYVAFTRVSLDFNIQT